MRRAPVVVLIGVVSGLLSVLLAVAVNVATGGTLPKPLDRVAWLAWPAVGLLGAVAVVLAIWQQRLAGPKESTVERTVPAELPAAPATFAGRDTEALAELDRAYEQFVLPESARLGEQMRPYLLGDQLE